MIKLFPRITLAFACLFVVFYQDMMAQSWAIRHFDTEDGLPGNITYNILQDKEGYIWIPTNNGICRYDGLEFKLYDSPLIKNNEILKCKEALGRIWFNTFSGNLFYIENDEVKPFPLGEKIQITDWIEADSNSMLIKTKGFGVTFPIYKMDETENGWEFNVFLEDNDQYGYSFGRIRDTAYVLHKGNLLKYEKRAEAFDTVTHNTYCRFISKVDNNTLLYQIEGDYFLFNGSSLDAINLLPNHIKKNVSIRSLYKDSKDRFWIVKEQSILLAKNIDDPAPIDVSSIINNSHCNELFEDKEGNIWFSTNTDGVYLLYNDHFIQYNSRNSKLPSNYIYDIAGDKDGNVYLASHLGYLTVMKEDSIIDVLRFEETKSEIYDLHISPKNEIVIALNNNIKGFEFKQQQSKLTEKYTYEIGTPKRIGTTSYGGISLASGSTLAFIEKNVTSQFQIWVASGTRTYNVLELSSHVFLAGTTHGVYDFYGKKNAPDIASKRIDTANGFRRKARNGFFGKHRKGYPNGGNIFHKNDWWEEPTGATDVYFSDPIMKKRIFQNGETIDDYIADMQYAKDSSIWIASRKDGVYHIVGDTIIHHYQASEMGLTSNICNRLFINNEDQVWVATMGGISLITPSKKYVQKITKEDGLISNHVTSIYCTDSLVYAGTAKGLTLFRKDQIAPKTLPPPIVIKQIKINEQDTLITDNYELPYKENSLYFGFIGLSYRGGIKYKYRLIGLSKDWIYSSNDHVRYSELQPGSYVFEVKSISKDGLESLESAKVRLKIKPYPPLSKTAFVIYGLLIIGGIILYFLQRERNIRKREVEKTAINKKIAELELQALQAQMNPHFVFNSLGAIQHFILQNDQQTASRYLADFGTLMRLFLESSEEKYISLTEELSLIELYIKLEKLRFSDQFSSSIEIAPEIDPQDIEIPSFLLQPFVENAINHGLRYKTEKGVLHIKFGLTDNKEALICVITDDGVGRKRSAEFKTSSFRSYKSRGTRIIEERMNVLAILEQNQIEVTITDLEDKKLDTGTKVKLIIPLD